MAHQYKEHPNLTLQLEDGLLVPVPASVEANATVWFSLPTEHGADQVWEGLLAHQGDDPGRAQIRAVPLFAHDLNYGDEVSVIASAESALVATGITVDAGNFTFRIWRDDADEIALQKIVSEFAGMGCYLEGYTEHLVGLSCGPDHVQAVAKALLKGEQMGLYVYETGRRAGA